MRGMEARSVLRRINPDLAKIDIACLKKILKCTFIKAMRKICCLSVHFLVFSKNFEKKANGQLALNFAGQGRAFRPFVVDCWGAEN